jgi:anti-sigma B factor antagonist
MIAHLPHLPYRTARLHLSPPRPLTLDRHDKKNRALLTLTGEIDLDTAPALRDALARCLHDGVRTIDVDLSAVTFCDCSGLNTFLEAALLTGAAGGSLRLHHPGRAVVRLFTLTGCDALFSGFPGSPARPDLRVPNAA